MKKVNKIKKSSVDEKMLKKSQELLLQIKPFLQGHGGDADIESVKNGEVTVKIKGHCAGCALSVFTFGITVDKMLKENVLGIKKVNYIS